MYRGYKFRIYPNKEQMKRVWNNINGARFAYNWTIEQRKAMQNNGQRYQINDNQLRDYFVEWKENSAKPWLTKRKICPCALSFSFAIIDANKTYDRYGRKSNFRRKKDHSDNTYKEEINGKNSFQIGTSGFRLSKVGWVKAKVDTREFIGQKLKNIRISFDGLCYWCSFLIEFDNQDTIEKEKTAPIGIDLGLKTFAICSNGWEFTSPSWEKDTELLKGLQRQASRKYLKHPKNLKKKSKRLKKLEREILTIHRRISNRQTTFIHKLTKNLIDENPAHVTIEDIKFSEWSKDKHRRVLVSKSQFFEFRRQLTYKCEWYGVGIKLAHKWFPSTQKCSGCGNVKRGSQKLQQSERVYTCDCCGLVIDRDYNASLNLAAL